MKHFVTSSGGNACFGSSMKIAFFILRVGRAIVNAPLCYMAQSLAQSLMTRGQSPLMMKEHHIIAFINFDYVYINIKGCISHHIRTMSTSAAIIKNWHVIRCYDFDVRF